MDKMRPLSKFPLSRSCISIASVLFCAVTLWLYFEIEEEFVGSEELQSEKSVTSWIKDLSEKNNCDQNNTSTLLYSNQAEVSQNCHIFSSDDKGIKNQCLKGEVAEIAGNVGSKSSGGLEGCAEIAFVDGRRQIANFINGTRHGLVKTFNCKAGSCHEFEEEEYTTPTYLEEVYQMDMGKRSGVGLWIRVGGGVLVGGVGTAESTAFSGPNIAYIYPDGKTALLGQFEKGKLVQAVGAEVTGMRTEPESSLIQPIMANLDNPEVYTYQESNRTWMGSKPLQRDPYEEKFLRVGPSTAKGGGRGVFLKRNAKAGTVVGFYNGVRLVGMESKVSEAVRRSPYRMDNDWSRHEEILDIPSHYRALDQYNATYGHLVNHSPSPNAAYSMFDHPRFGKIRSIVLLKDLESGEELFCDYGYAEKYLRTEKAVRSVFKLGQWISNKTEEEFKKELKHHVRYIRNIVHQYKPVISMLASAIGGN